jgi:hypothetical protein
MDAFRVQARVVNSHQAFKSWIESAAPTARGHADRLQGAWVAQGLRAATHRLHACALGDSHAEPAGKRGGNLPDSIVAPDWLLTLVPSDWFDRYGMRVEEYRQPKGKEAREVYAAQIGADGFRLLDDIDADDSRPWLWAVPAMQTLGQMWVHQYTRQERRVLLRAARELPPAGERFDWPYDPKAHYGKKRTITWTGYTVRPSDETCDPHAPLLITHVETTSASTTDVTMTAPIHEALAAKGSSAMMPIGVYRFTVG